MPRPVTHLANLDLNLLVALREPITHQLELLDIRPYNRER